MIHKDQLAHCRTLKKNLIALGQTAYWPSQSISFANKLRTCGQCLQSGPKVEPKRATISSKLYADRPGVRLSYDIVGKLRRSKSGCVYILTCMDWFSKKLWAYALKDRSARSIAECLHHLFTTFEHFAEIHSDNAQEMRSAVVQQLCKSFNVAQTFTVPYTARQNNIERIIAP